MSRKRTVMVVAFVLAIAGAWAILLSTSGFRHTIAEAAAGDADVVADRNPSLGQAPASRTGQALLPVQQVTDAGLAPVTEEQGGDPPAWPSKETTATVRSPEGERLVASKLREQALYPPNSRALAPGEYPVVDNFEIPRESLGSFVSDVDGERLRLISYTKKNSFAAHEPLVLHAFLENEDGVRVPIDDSEVILTRPTAAPSGMDENVASTSLSDDGKRGDETAGDLIYTAQFLLAQNKRPGPPTNLDVDVTVRRGGGPGITGNMTFTVADMAIESTGGFVDRLETDADGTHLLIEAEFRISKPGYYMVEGSLYGRGDVPIAYASGRQQLKPGRHKLPLRFFGKALCDKALDGPYVLKNLGYSNVTLMPGPRSVLMTDAHTTGAYQASRFSCAGFGDPVLIRKAMTIEAGAEQMEVGMRGEGG